jgi:probable phosphoglycerate mutase
MIDKNDTIVYITRHGQTDWNIEKRFQGHFDIPLNETGKKQAAELSLILKNKNIKSIYTSPKTRAVETAEIINHMIKSNVEVVPELREITHGIFDGLTMDEVYSREEESIKLWRSDRINIAPPEGESIRQCYDRVVPVYDSIVRENIGQAVLIVSHLVVTKSLLIHCLGVPLETFWRFDQTSAALNKVRHNNNGAIVELLNYSEHTENL